MPERWRSLEESVAIHQKLADARTEKPEEMKLDLLALTVGVMALSERVEAALRTMSHTDDTARE